jgi:hypothetical protein
MAETRLPLPWPNFETPPLTLTHFTALTNRRSVPFLRPKLLSLTYTATYKYNVSSNLVLRKANAQGKCARLTSGDRSARRGGRGGGRGGGRAAAIRGPHSALTDFLAVSYACLAELDIEAVGVWAVAHLTTSHLNDREVPTFTRKEFG